MKRLFVPFVCLAGLACSAADLDTLRKLKTSATAADLPYLATCLTNEALSIFARDVLETLPAPAAGNVLLDAAKTTTGEVRLGIIQTLGIRRDALAVRHLASLLKDSNPAVVAAAAGALGRIGTFDCAIALKDAAASATPETHRALFDAALRCAETLRVTGDTNNAAKLFGSLYTPEAPADIRSAAYRGVLLTDGKGAPKLFADALKGNDLVSRNAALLLAGEMHDQESIAAINVALRSGEPGVQIALLASIARDVSSAVPSPFIAAAHELARSRDEALAVSACDALSEIGGADSVALLAGIAADSDGRRRDAARRALTTIRRGDVGSALVEALKESVAKTLPEIIRALSARRETKAVPALIGTLTGGDASQMTSASKAIAVLGTPDHVPALLTALRSAKSEESRSAIEGSLAGILARTDRDAAITRAVLDAMKDAAIETRASLLRLAARLGGGEAMAALESATKSSEAKLRDAALRALGQATDASAATILLRAADGGRNDEERAFAMQGFWNVVAAAGSFPDRDALCRDAYAKCRTASERRAGLSMIATLASTQALALAVAACSDTDVKAEAELAVAKISERLKSGSAFADFMTGWEVSGPYRAAGKGAAALFDTPFAPENADANVIWRPLPAAADATNTWWADLSGVVAGHDAVVYLRTRVYSPSSLDVVLAMGSDDGNKVWINGALVHAKNVMRALRRDEDKAPAKLNAGWNEVLVKVTQNIMGCGFCLRIRAANGEIIEGLHCDPAGK